MSDGNTQAVLARREPVPLYYQLETLLRKAIESGEYGPQSPVPTEAELSRLHGVSRVTVRQALQRLEDDGLILRSRGRRTTVVEGRREGRIERNLTNARGFEEDMLRLGLNPRAEILETETITAQGTLIELLGVEKDAELLRVRRRGLSDDRPLWLESRYFPVDIGKALLASGELASAAMMPLIERHSGYSITDIEIALEAAVANERQARLLEIGLGSPIHHYEKRVFGNGGRVLLFMRAVFPAGAFRFTYRYHAPPLRLNSKK
jgi:GntR family transcriptional regulator